MTLHRRQAMMLLVIGMALIVMMIVLRQTGASDFVVGMLGGTGIGLEILAIILLQKHKSKPQR